MSKNISFRESRYINHNKEMPRLPEGFGFLPVNHSATTYAISKDCGALELTSMIQNINAHRFLKIDIGRKLKKIK